MKVEIIRISDCTAEEAVKVLRESNYGEPVMATNIELPLTPEEDECEEIGETEAPVVVKKTRNRKKKEEEVEPAPVVTELTPEQMFSEPAPVTVTSPASTFTVPTPVTAQVQAVVAAPVQEQPRLYDNVFERIRNAFQAGKIGNEYVNMTVKEINGIFGLNVTGFHELKNYPEAIKHVHGSLIQKGL